MAKRFLEPARLALGATAWARARAEGSELSFDDAISAALDDVALRDSTPSPGR